jgi:hypothetical protein
MGHQIGSEPVDVEEPAPTQTGAGADRAGAVLRRAEAAPQIDVVIGIGAPGLGAEAEFAIVRPEVEQVVPEHRDRHGQVENRFGFVEAGGDVGSPAQDQDVAGQAGNPQRRHRRCREGNRSRRHDDLVKSRIDAVDEDLDQLHLRRHRFRRGAEMRGQCFLRVGRTLGSRRAAQQQRHERGARSWCQPAASRGSSHSQGTARPAYRISTTRRPWSVSISTLPPRTGDFSATSTLECASA